MNKQNENELSLEKNHQIINIKLNDEDKDVNLYENGNGNAIYLKKNKITENQKQLISKKRKREESIYKEPRLLRTINVSPRIQFDVFETSIVRLDGKPMSRKDPKKYVCSSCKEAKICFLQNNQMSVISHGSNCLRDKNKICINTDYIDFDYINKKK